MKVTNYVLNGTIMNKSHTASDINLIYKYVKFTHF